TSDALGRQTTYTYDGCGNTTSITRLAGTPNAVTTTMAYQTAPPGTQYPCVTAFNQITSITDPLNHTNSFGYDTSGANRTSVTDANQNTSTIVPNADGQPASITTFAGTIQFGYTNGDLTFTTDQTNNTTRRTFDPAGRLIRLQSPGGNIKQYDFDELNSLLK